MIALKISSGGADHSSHMQRNYKQKQPVSKSIDTAQFADRNFMLVAKPNDDARLTD